MMAAAMPKRSDAYVNSDNDAGGRRPHGPQLLAIRPSTSPTPNTRNVIGTNKSPVMRPYRESVIAAQGDTVAGLSTLQMNAVTPGHTAKLQPIVRTILMA
eukprot:GHUV01036082.1.p3 GENE.GHUV01036082.1~~GHUV01036082.1.p3  ORF type:complete len:100 (+),score=4.36 GHUV01036082.1:164-463(+)